MVSIKGQSHTECGTSFGVRLGRGREGTNTHEEAMTDREWCADLYGVLKGSPGRSGTNGRGAQAADC